MARKPESLDPVEEERKEAWLQDLARFIVEANTKTWAADLGGVKKPERPGYKEVEYPRREIEDEIPATGFYLRDSYSGYFRAPGMTTIYYNGRPAWTMQFGGHGQTEGHEGHAKQTFDFLRSALMQVSKEMPFRGPARFEDGNKVYTFDMLEGDITDGMWREVIIEDGEQTFTQVGIVGIVIHKGPNREPIMPWNIK